MPIHLTVAYPQLSLEALQCIQFRHSESQCPKIIGSGYAIEGDNKKTHHRLA